MSRPTPPPVHDVSCVAHIHSTYSDGRATVTEIVEAARAAGRDVVLLTDHDTLEARRQGWEGWHDGVLLLVGTEISPRAGHLLAFGIDQEIEHGGRTEDELIEAVAAAGGICFAAHPFSEGSRISTKIGRPHPWGALEHPSLTGVELWSLQTDAAEAWRGPREAIRFLRDPEAEITGPPSRNLRAWDELCRGRRTVAIGGLDAHEPGLRIRSHVRTPMPHRRYFGLLGTHALLPDPFSGDTARDRRAVYEALARGHCYLALDQLATTSGFAFWAQRGDRPTLLGGEITGNGWTLHATTPVEADIGLFRDGTEVARERTGGLSLDAPAPGAYRVEARLDFRGRSRSWIISNPIYVR
jgi:hypothetical protein